eukprot:5984527-Amphidinium_carterae.1
MTSTSRSNKATQDVHQLCVNLKFAGQASATACIKQQRALWVETSVIWSLRTIVTIAIPDCVCSTNATTAGYFLGTDSKVADAPQSDSQEDAIPKRMALT